MTSEPQEARKQTQTTPKGLEVPVPTREEFLRNMDKVAPSLRRDEPERVDEQP